MHSCGLLICIPFLDQDALDLQKRAAQRREKAANAKEDVHSWVTQELEVLLSTVDAECSLEKLKIDKAYFASQLAELQLHNESDNALSNQAQVSELMEFVELRNKQIKDLEQHIKESNQGININCILGITLTKKVLQNFPM